MHKHPNLVTTLSNRNHTTVSAVQSVTGDSSTHLVRYYVIVMVYLSPDLLSCGLIGPTKSTSHFSKACNVTYGFNGISACLDGLPTLLQMLQE
jgi:hypothetical protein